MAVEKERLLSNAVASLLTLTPVLVGTAYAAHDAFPFRAVPFVLCVLAGLAAHVAVAAILRAGSAEASRTDLAVAAGGAGIALLASAALVPYAGAAVLGLLLAGILLAAAYLSPPLPVRDLGGLGELAVALAFGPVLVCLGYVSQSSQLSSGAFLASLPVGILTAAVAFADHFAHARAGADPLCPVVRLGESQARLLALALPVFGALAIVLDVRLLEYPQACLGALIPVAAWLFLLRGLSAEAPRSGSRVAWLASALCAIAAGLLIVAGFLV